MNDTQPVMESGAFFVALPDSPDAGRLVHLLLPRTNLHILHPSGRPWILGRVSSDEVVTAAAGSSQAALIGHPLATEAHLERLVGQLSSARDGVDVSPRFAGSFCTLVSVDGETYASGPAAESRRIVSARMDGVHVVADRADVLAELGSLAIDEAALVMRMLGSLPHPLANESIWRGVHLLPGDQYLIVSESGRRTSIGTWWSVPEPHLSRQAGATALRHAMDDAVAARTHGGRQIACDLSGGLDSTPLCYFAAHGPSGVLARTLYHEDPGGQEDLRWAQRAVGSMPGVHTHLVHSTDEFEEFYEGVENVGAPMDEPTQAITAGPRIRQLLADDQRRGVSVHLNGFGGDHILRGVPVWEHTLARRRPWLAWRRARSIHIPSRVRAHVTLRELADRTSYQSWLRGAVDHALTGGERPGLDHFDQWSFPFTGPPWLSSGARDLVRERVAALVDASEPLHPTRAGHLDVFSVRSAARLVRGTAQLGQPFSVAYEAPLIDDRVVEAALSVRREERDTPLEWKPLMKEAMRGHLPDEYLMRTTKVGGGAQSVRGYSRHFETLMGLVEESGLIEEGLVDGDALRRSCRPNGRDMPEQHMHEAVNAAVFLRNWQRAPLLAQPDASLT